MKNLICASILASLIGSVAMAQGEATGAPAAAPAGKKMSKAAMAAKACKGQGLSKKKDKKAWAACLKEEKSK